MKEKGNEAKFLYVVYKNQNFLQIHTNIFGGSDQVCVDSQSDVKC